MLAVVDGSQDYVPVNVGRGIDDHCVHIVAVQRCLQIALERHVELGGGSLAALRVVVPDAGHLQVGMVHYMTGVAPRVDMGKAEHRNP